MTEHVYFEGVLEKTAGILKNNKVWMVLHKKSLNYYKENRIFESCIAIGLFKGHQNITVNQSSSDLHIGQWRSDFNNHVNRSSCIGSIDLSEVQTVRPLPEKGGTRFEISTGTRSFIFAADSSEKCKEWVNQIHKAWAAESTQGDESGISHNSSIENKHEDFSHVGSTAVMKKNWEKMISNTADSPISQPSLGNYEQVVQRRPSKKDKSDSHNLESFSQNSNKKPHLSGPYDKPWSSYLSVISGTENSSSSLNGASADPEASSTQQRNDPNGEMSCVSVGCSNDKVEEDDLDDKVEDDGKYSQKIISEPQVPNSCSDQTQRNSMAIRSKESPTEQKDRDKSEPEADIVEMRRSRTIVKVHRDGSVSNVEDANRDSQEPAMRSKSRDVSKLQRQEAFETHYGSQPEAGEDSRGTADSSKDPTSQYAIVNHKPEVVALNQRPSVDSQSDLVQEASEDKETTLLTFEAKTSASLTVNSGKPSTRLIELLTENAVPHREINKFKPYALKELKIFLENNCDLVCLNLHVERYSTAMSGMEALKEFLNGN